MSQPAPSGTASSRLGKSTRRAVTRAAPLLAAVGLTGVAGASFAPFYAGLGWRLPVFAALVVGTALAVWLRVVSWHPVVRVMIAVVATVAVSATLSTLLSRTGSPVAVGALRDAILAPLQGWSRMLSVGLPAEPTPDLLVLPVVGTFVASLSSGLIAIRSRTRLLAALPPFLLYLLALLVTATVREPQIWLALAFLVLSLLLALVQAEADGNRTRAQALDHDVSPHPISTESGRSAPLHRAHLAMSRSVAGIPLVAIVCLAAGGLTLLSPLASAAQRYDPRDSRVQTPETRSVLSPMLGLKRELTTAPPVALFTVSNASGSPVPSRIRTAYLGDFDGVMWSDTDHFERPAASIATGLPSQGRSSVTVRITIDHLAGPFLPVVGDPTVLTGDKLARGVSRGNVIGPSEGGAAGLTYDVTAVTALDSSDPRLSDAETGGPQWRPGDVTLPEGLPEAVRSAAVQATATAPTPLAKAMALQKLLLEAAGYSLKAPPGESYATVALLLGRQSPYAAAFAEQRASAFVVLARAVGLPARVAVGYRVKPSASQPSSVTITTADAHAWPEVLFGQYGWVAFEPTDLAAPDVARAPDTPAGPGDEVRPNSGGDQGATVDPSLTVEGTSLPRLVLLVLAVVGATLLLGSGLVVIAKRLRRRARLGASGTARQVLGAWAEALDRLVEHGYRAPASSTAAEVAQRLSARFDPDVARPMDMMAPLVAAAVFAPGPPSRADAKSAWSCEAELARTLGARRPALLRLPRYADPRPLLPNSAARARVRGRRRNLALRRWAGRRRGRPARSPSGP